MSVSQTKGVMMRMQGLMGERVKIRSIGDRNKVIFLEGRVDGVYPSLFTVSCSTEEGESRRCFSYREILTHRLYIKRYEE